LLPGVGVNLLIHNIQALTEVLAFFSLRNALIKKNFIESNYVNNAIAVLVILLDWKKNLKNIFRQQQDLEQ